MTHTPDTAAPAQTGLRLSIIIVTWNIRDVLADCLRSLYAEDIGVPHEVIVVDNGSVDGTWQLVETEYPQIRLLRNAENLGFSKANNQGMKIANGDYVLLLNSDTVIIDPGVFRPWIEFMDSRPDVAMSGCRLLFPDRTHQVGDAGFRPAFGTMLAHNLFLNRLFPHHLKGLFVSFREPPGRMEVDWITGADVLCRRSLLPEVGMLDESIFFYAEDIEWGSRVRTFGHKVYYLSDLTIVHLQGATTKNYPEKFSGQDLKNMRRIYARFNPERSLLVFDLIMALGFALRSSAYACMWWQEPEFRNARARRMFKYLRASLANIGTPAG